MARRPHQRGERRARLKAGYQEALRPVPKTTGRDKRVVTWGYENPQTGETMQIPYPTNKFKKAGKVVGVMALIFFVREPSFATESVTDASVAVVSENADVVGESGAALAGVPGEICGDSDICDAAGNRITDISNAALGRESSTPPTTAGPATTSPPTTELPPVEATEADGVLDLGTFVCSTETVDVSMADGHPTPVHAMLSVSPELEGSNSTWNQKNTLYAYVLNQPANVNAPTAELSNETTVYFNVPTNCRPE